jgi:hypothetical protein
VRARRAAAATAGDRLGGAPCLGPVVVAPPSFQLTFFVSSTYLFRLSLSHALVLLFLHPTLNG